MPAKNLQKMRAYSIICRAGSFMAAKHWPEQSIVNIEVRCVATKASDASESSLTPDDDRNALVQNSQRIRDKSGSWPPFLQNLEI